ncbi:MAG: efflux RND transporter permease subunit [Gammaproteobacteria bacterium]|nr:efflux RND transporter permease subunit [Gammaproteobacteria bacterium]MBU1653488.1 efflux RND transporter permease subunit [Gammaproteobacteria bacterium]MBU1962729.1 efflux RND transporter permease subunit [Gammaproteobacteria bacterium]
MTRWILESSLRLRLIVTAAAVALVYFGVMQLAKAPIDVLPEFSPPRVEIQTEALGLSAEEVEQLITVPLEQDLLNGVAWLESIESKSVPGMSSVELTFEPGSDVIQDRQMVSERMAQAYALPNVSRPSVMLQPVSSSSRFLMVGLSSQEVSLIQMGVLAHWTITPRLLGVPGVANVAVWGLRNRELQVQVDPARLQASGASLHQVLVTAGNALWVSPLSFVEASTPGTGGFIETPNQRFEVQHILPINTPGSLSQVPISGVKKPDGSPLRLGDVANVVENHQPLIGDALVNDAPSLILVLEKFPDTNTLAVTQKVEKALTSMRAGLPGIEIDTAIYRPASYIQTALENLGESLLPAVGLLALLLLAYFNSWRGALIGLAVISLSLLTALLVLQVRGETFNLMLLAGLVIALGVLIDDAIGDIGNLLNRLRAEGEDASISAGLVIEGLLQGRKAMAITTLILLLAAAPVYFMTGMTGAFLKPAMLSYGLAILASLAVALIATPALALLLLSKGTNGKGQGILAGLFGSVGSSLSALGRGMSPLVAGVALAGSVLSLYMLATAGQSWLPNIKERTLMVQVEAVAGTSRQEMERVTTLISRDLRNAEGVQNISSHIGRAVVGDQVVNVNSAELWVNLAPTAAFEQTLAAVEERVSGYPGLRIRVQSYLDSRAAKALGQDDDAPPIQVRLYGENTDLLISEAEKIREAIAKIGGADVAPLNPPPVEPVLEIKLDLDKAQQHGIKPGDVRRAASTLFAGITVGSLFEEQKVFNVVVWGTPESRQSMSSIQDMVINTAGGGHVRLGEVAQVQIAPTRTVIPREAVSRYIDIGVDAKGRSLDDLAAEIGMGLKELKLPLEFHAELKGSYQADQAACNRLILLGAVALIGSLFLLQTALRSWSLAGAMVIGLPFALLGGVLTILVNDGTLGLGTLFGLLAVLALAVRNGLALIGEFDRREKAGESFGGDLVLNGIREQGGSILATALGLALVLLPLLIQGSIPGLELLSGMALAILGGLVTTTLFSLVLVPALYLLFGEGRAPELELETTA